MESSNVLSSSLEYLSFRSNIPCRKIVVEEDSEKVINVMSWQKLIFDKSTSWMAHSNRYGVFMMGDQNQIKLLSSAYLQLVGVQTHFSSKF